MAYIAVGIAVGILLSLAALEWAFRAAIRGLSRPPY